MKKYTIEECEDAQNYYGGKRWFVCTIFANGLYSGEDCSPKFKTRVQAQEYINEQRAYDKLNDEAYRYFRDSKF